MKLDKFMWTREPNDFKIKDNTVEITTKQIPTYGKELIIIFGMIMHRYIRWKQKKSISVLL